MVSNIGGKNVNLCMHWADEECTPVDVYSSRIVVSKIRLVISRIRSAGKVSVRQYYIIFTNHTLCFKKPNSGFFWYLTIVNSIFVRSTSLMFR